MHYQTLGFADTYDSFGRVSRTALGPSGVAVDYTHTLAGAVRTITAPKFTQTLLRTEGKNPLWGGGISANLWRGADGIARRYDYAFDGFGRLTAADYSESGRSEGSLASGSPAADYSCAYAYDLNSNPTSIVRRGVTRKSTPLTVVPKSLTITMPVAPTTYTFGLIDDLSLVRDGNKLRYVDDGPDTQPIYAGAPDFPDGVGDSLEYEYDPNGNLTRDDNRGYTAAYNLLNLPAHIKGEDGTIIRNYYDTSGILLRREVTTPNVSKNPITGGNTTMMETVTDDYVGDLVFVSNNKPKIKGEPDPTTIRVITSAGFVDTDGKVHSHVRDYQGNVRQVLDEEGNVEQSSDYYPYGMLMGESDLSATSSSPNPFRFGGKHYLTAVSIFLHDFAARFYDAALITFTSHDAITTNSYPTTPFLYCNADPINFIDPTGMDEYTIGTNGALISQVKNEENDVVIIGDQRLTLPYGAIEYKCKSIDSGDDISLYSYYSVRGSENGKKLFEFMADNCTVTDVDSDGKHIGAEVSWAEFEGGNQALNVVSTSSKFNSEGSFLYLMYNNRSELPKLLNQVHSHHSIQPGAAGPNPSKEDVDFNAELLKVFAEKKKPIQPNFFLYYKGTYTDYSEKVYIQWKSLLK